MATEINVGQTFFPLIVEKGDVSGHVFYGNQYSSVGFTGSSEKHGGMTDAQKKTLTEKLKELKRNGAIEFHHGDCNGADADVHDIASKLGYETHVHPPDDSSQRAFKQGDVIHEEKPYKDRNKDIVNSSDIVLGAVRGDEKSYPRSGTWATLRYARNQKVPHEVIQRDGSSTSKKVFKIQNPVLLDPKKKKAPFLREKIREYGEPVQESQVSKASGMHLTPNDLKAALYGPLAICTECDHPQYLVSETDHRLVCKNPKCPTFGKPIDEVEKGGPGSGPKPHGALWATSTGNQQVEGEPYKTTSHGTKREAVDAANEARNHGHTVGVYQLDHPASVGTQPIGPGKGIEPRSAWREFQVRHKETEKVVKAEAGSSDTTTAGVSTDTDLNYRGIEGGKKPKRRFTATPGKFDRMTEAARAAVKTTVNGAFAKMKKETIKILRSKLQKEMISKTVLAKAGDDDAGQIADEVMAALAQHFEDLPDDVRAHLADAVKEAIVMTAKDVNSVMGTEIIDTDMIAHGNEVARMFADTRAAEMVGMKYVAGVLVPNPDAQYQITATTRDMIRDILADAFSKETPLSEIIDQIQLAGPFSDYRAEMIARTEVKKAQIEGLKMMWQQTGLVNAYDWLLSSIDPCEECQQIADDGPYSFDDPASPYPVDDSHPNCMCSIASAELTDPTEEADNEKVNKRYVTELILKAFPSKVQVSKDTSLEAEIIEKGDVPGHLFHGNQYSSALSGIPKKYLEGLRIKIGKPLSGGEAEHNPMTHTITIDKEALRTKRFGMYDSTVNPTEYLNAHPKERVVSESNNAYGVEQKGEHNKEYMGHVISHEVGHHVWETRMSPEQREKFTSSKEFKNYHSPTTFAYDSYIAERRDQGTGSPILDRKLEREKFAEMFREHIMNGKFNNLFRNIKAEETDGLEKSVLDSDQSQQKSNLYWHGVDLDCTLAEHDASHGVGEIGTPIPLMVARVRRWLADGERVKIFTARVADDPDGEQRRKIEDWSLNVFGRFLPITCEKDQYMIDIWDDKAHGVVPNTGIEKFVEGVLTDVLDEIRKGDVLGHDFHGNQYTESSGLTEARQKYESAMKEFRTASANHRQITLDYRSGKVGDKEFIGSKQKLDEAQNKSDAAERELIAIQEKEPAPVENPVTDPRQHSLFGNKVIKGGSGSGNYGHEGREGEVGGSSIRGGGGEKAVYDKENKTWKHESGKDVPDHIKAAKIPPAWKNVRYDPDPQAGLLVLGEDKKGNYQPIYSAKFMQDSADAKFARVNELDKKYDQIEKQVGADLANGKNVEEASCLRLVMKTGIRPGSDTDTGADKKAYGATTLTGAHVVGDSPDNVRLQFVGKKGKDLDIPVTDKAVAEDLLARRDKVGADGRLFTTDNKKVLAYSDSKDGGGFKTKDYRTLVGTRTAQAEVAKMPAPTDAKSYKKSVMSVGKVVSAKLGNTPSVALSSYIRPGVFAKWRMKAGV